MKRIVVIATIALFVVTACGGSGKGSKAKDSAKGSTTTATLFGGDSPLLGEGGTTGGTSGGSGRSTTTSKGAKGSTSSTAPVDRHGGPRPGTYQYDETLADAKNSTHGNVGFQVIDDRAIGDGWRSITTWVEGKKANRMLVTWRLSGRTVEFEQDAQGKSVSPLCDWTPDYLDLATPLKVGAKWSATSTCDQGHTVTKDRVFTGEVTGTDKVSVAGTSVDVFVIHRKVSSTSHIGDHRIRRDEDYTDRFAPSVGLLIQSSGTDTDFLDGVPKGIVTRTRSLQSLQPGS
jgi:hypothetical protein